MENGNFHFVSLNVRGIREKLKRNKIFLWLNRQKCDIAFLQETFLTKDMEQLVSRDWKGFCIFDHGTNHSRGVAIIIRKDLSVNICDKYFKCDGRGIALRLSFCGTVYLCLNVYAPAKNNEKEIFYSSLINWVQKIRKQNDVIIAGGDWNCVMNKKLDTNGLSYAYLPKQNFTKFQKKFNLIDVWRKTYPERRQFTWRQVSLNIYSRLDYWLISKSHFSYICSLDIKPALKCDHNAISMKVKVTTKKRGKGYWKFNNSMLKDDVYKQMIKNIIKKVNIEYNNFNKQLKWEMCKIKIREFSMKYAHDVKEKRNKHIKNVEKEYKELCEYLDENLCTEKVERMKNLKHEIDRWYEYQCKGAFVRSRARWLEFGEKSSKYFLQLEKAKGTKKEIDCIEVDDKIIKNDEEILINICKYYSNLYEKKNTNSDFKDYISNVKLNMLSAEDAQICEGKLTENECWQALKSMNLNKSPGGDGLSVEFYRYFWGDVKQMVLDSLNEGYDKKELSSTQSQATLTLLYKKGNKKLLDNWRPISLLNIDYKLAASVLTLRLKKIIHKIVSHDQAGFMKKRSAAECIRFIQDTIEYCKHTNKAGIILFLDFMKGFDTVDHEFLFNLLREFGFKHSFVTWIETLYSNANGRILNNGWISESFCIGRGVRQGCPLSALLFIIVAEVLAAKINQSPNIQGIRVPRHVNDPECKDIRIIQYADDTTIFTNSIDFVKNIMKEVELFGVNAGPKINWSKSKFMKLNISEKTVEGLKFTENPIKCLGIYVGKNIQEIENLNWEGRSEKIRGILDSWRMRNLSLYGKVTVIKHLIISQMVYTATAVPVPSKIIKIVNKLIFTFLWNSKKERVKRSICQLPEKQGGLGMFNLESKCQSLRLSWIKRYFTGEESAWKILFSYWTNKIGKLPICLRYNCNKNDMYNLCKKKKLPNFYVDLFCSWSHLKYQNVDKVKNIENQIVWYNSNIKYKNQMLYMPYWVNKGILKVTHVLEDGVWKEIEAICNIFCQRKLLSSFELLKLKSAFPKLWLDKLRNTNREEYVNTCTSQTDDSHMIELGTGDSINVDVTSAKHYYQLISSASTHKPSFVSFWQTYFQLPGDFVWDAVFKCKFLYFNDNRLKQFNFKLLHRILPSKYNLCKWKIMSENLCDACGMPETTFHFLISCKKVTTFWKIVLRIIRYIYNVDVIADERIIVLGYLIENPKQRFINLVLNFAQFIIYRNYIRGLNQDRKYRMHAMYLLRELKTEVRNYLNLKFNQKNFEAHDVEKLCQYLNS